MIGPLTKLAVVDNSGALVVGCISVPKLLRRTGPNPGNTLTVSVKKSIFKKNIKKKSRIISKSQIVQALLIVSVKGAKRQGFFRLKDSLNAVVLFNQYDLPYGTRINGPMFREVRATRFKKIVNLAKILI